MQRGSGRHYLLIADSWSVLDSVSGAQITGFCSFAVYQRGVGYAKADPSCAMIVLLMFTTIVVGSVPPPIYYLIIHISSKKSRETSPKSLVSMQTQPEVNLQDPGRYPLDHI